MASDKPCDGCGRVFPNLESSVDLCPKCRMLEEHPINSAKYQDIQDWPQCVMCGKSFRHMKKVTGDLQLCQAPECTNATLEPTLAHSSQPQSSQSGTSQPSLLVNPTPNLRATMSDISDAHMNRVLATRDRFKQTPAFRNIVPGTELTTMLLKHHEQALNPVGGEGTALVCWSYRRSDKAKSLDAKLGSGSCTFSLSTYLPEIQAHIVSILNAEWLKNHTLPLNLSEVSLRFSNNFVLEGGTSTMMLRDFIQHYSGPGKPLLTSTSALSQLRHVAKSQKMTVLCLEGFIHTEMYEKRYKDETEQESCDPEILINSRRRCYRSDSVISTRSQTIKQPRTISCMTNRGVSVGSMFWLPSQQQHQVINKTTKILFKKVICTLNSDTGDVSFSELQDAIHGFLHNVHFAKGSMKLGYELVLAGDNPDGLFVAKRFFRMNDDASADKLLLLGLGGIDIQTHNTSIQAECRHLFQGQWFLSSFYGFCSKLGVTVDMTLKFANAFLLQEDALESPSPASSAKTYTNELNGVMWLVEKRRPQSIHRFSGTLHHPTLGNDLRSSTISAFTHFSFGHSNHTLVFADIQGTPTLVNGRDGLVLFDPMTHTLSSDSGIGDFGSEGINAFIEGHHCGDICKRLRLDEEIPLKLLSTAKGNESGGSLEKDGLNNKGSDDEDDDHTENVD